MKPTPSPSDIRRGIRGGGGLWSAGELVKVVGPHARAWPTAKGFPEPAWHYGKLRLYTGWSVWGWAEDTGRLGDAARLKVELDKIRRASV